MVLARPIVLGNWKMHGRVEDGLALARSIAAGRPTAGTLGIFPPHTIIGLIAKELRGQSIMVGAQDCHEQPKGAFTGSIAAAMIADLGATAVILGHSERRHGLGESDARIQTKVQSALAAGLMPVVCIGETEAEWSAGERDQRLASQIALSLPRDLDAQKLIVAYEPVWAIGTGRTPTLEDIGDAHGFIRAELSRHLPGGASVPILYGGSVKADNAAAILGIADVDGALVGGASLDPEAFVDILKAGSGT